MKVILFCASLTLLITASKSLKTKFTPCGGQVNEVRLFGCKDDLEPCVIQRGTKGRLEVDFIAPFETRSLYADVRGRTGTSRLSIYMPWTGLDKDGCVGHGITCPIKKNAKQTYFYEMVVDNSYPQFKTDAIWKLTDYWGFTVACFKMDMQIMV